MRLVSPRRLVLVICAAPLVASLACSGTTSGSGTGGSGAHDDDTGGTGNETAAGGAAEDGTAAGGTAAGGTAEGGETSAGGGGAQECEPADRRCDGGTVQVCRESGSGWDSDVDCEAADQACSSGACVDRACVPDELFCSSGDAYRCSPDGLESSLDDTCLASETCDEGVCIPQSCEPSTAACLGNVVGTCALDGLSVTTDGESEDCTLADQACWSGACHEVVCEPDAQFCDDDSAYDCEDNGTSVALLDECGASHYCVESALAASCAPNPCTPNQPACDGNRATSCNSDGSGFQPGGTDCGGGEQCVLGTCLPIVCEPDQEYCGPGYDVLLCGPDGTTASIADDCAPNEHCDEDTVTCEPDLCTAGQPTCDGNAVATCAADGSGPLPGNSPCEGDTLCVSGACLDVYCTPHEKYCASISQVQTCNATGTDYTSSYFCSSGSHCFEVESGRSECMKDICDLGEPACLGEQVAECFNGFEYADLGTDCAALGQVCNGTSCVDSLVETVGDISMSAPLGANRALANLYRFSGQRTITEIEHYLGIGGVDQLTWFIYERPLIGLVDGGLYTKVFERLTSSSGTQYHSSGALSFTVDPSKTYLIGVRAAAATTTYYDSPSKQILSGGYADRRHTDIVTSTPLPTTLHLPDFPYLFAQRLTFE